ncbi:tripartite motif-containing protein 16-like [Polypterus senegalus]|uniref:tripartite motif-containing protein 16-like n=1 Tax=Polypterus senegalus TaxID=55291 RepID=UPI001965404A|nr:tripartite motif-containing protein 16-like [Polypterus senegalus]
MAEENTSLPQEQFHCCMCLETLGDSVSSPFGIHFCKKCIQNGSDKTGEVSYQECRETVNLCKDTVIIEAEEELKPNELSPAPSQSEARHGDVGCDACTGKRRRAEKFCVTCLASFCETHIQLHYQVPAWKDHKLIDPSENVQRKLCTKHLKSLDIFCKTDQACICIMCVMDTHNTHVMVEPQKERTEKQIHLEAIRSENQKTIEERQTKLEKMKKALEQIKMSADKEVQECEKNFTDLIHCIEETCRKVTEQFRQQETREMKKVEAIIKRLEKEIETLKKRDAEVTELLVTDDNIHFLQTFSSLCVPPAKEDLTNMNFMADFSCQTLRKEVSLLKQRLEKLREVKIEKVTSAVSVIPLHIPMTPEQKCRPELLKYFCHLTLDPNTANGHLILSEGNKKVTVMKKETIYPDHPDRFDHWWQVLCKEALSGTRYYWELVLSGRETEIGVTYKKITRKGKGRDSHIGRNEESCTLTCFSISSLRHNGRHNKITVPHYHRIGVYLDWPAGSLLFFRVTDTMTLLHKFQSTFTEPLYPAFWLPYKDSCVTICTLNKSSHS